MKQIKLTTFLCVSIIIIIIGSLNTIENCMCLRHIPKCLQCELILNTFIDGSQTSSALELLNFSQIYSTDGQSRKDRLPIHSPQIQTESVMRSATRSHNPSIPKFFPVCSNKNDFSSFTAPFVNILCVVQDVVYSKFSSFIVQKFLKYMTIFLLFKFPAVITCPFKCVKE